MIPDPAPPIDWESVRKAMIQSCMPKDCRAVFHGYSTMWEPILIPPVLPSIDWETVDRAFFKRANFTYLYGTPRHPITYQEKPMPNLVFQFKDGEYLTPVPSPMPVNRNPFFTGGRYRTPKPELAWCFTSVNDALINLYRLITFVGMNGGELPDTPPRLVEVVKRERTVTEWLTRDITVLTVH